MSRNSVVSQPIKNKDLEGLELNKEIKDWPTKVETLVLRRKRALKKLRKKQ